jgi:hypothetical protein|tara:strand:+ start:44 stop:598 length:555 start_codon:yes stop_codon:yes gene_type:complete
MKIADCGPLIQLVNLHGENLIGMEVGVFRGESLLAFLMNCENIKEMHGVDSWEEYYDYLGSLDGRPVGGANACGSEINKAITEISLKHCDYANKAILHHMDSNKCAETFDDEYFDFIFVDVSMTDEQVNNDLNVWYPKVKKGGLFTGHDWDYIPLQESVHQFRETHNVKTRLSTYSNCFAWVKD